MKAEPLNIALIGKTPEQIKKLLYLYNKPFKFDNLENNEWYPSEEEKDYFGEEEYDKMIRMYNDKQNRIYFKNVKLSWDSCDCGDGYGCSHGSWVYEILVKKPDYIRNDIINRIKNTDIDTSYNRKRVDYWVFEFEDENYYTIEVKRLGEKGYAAIPIPKTIGDFIFDCHRIGVELEWSDLVSKLYFEENSNIMQLILF